MDEKGKQKDQRDDAKRQAIKLDDLAPREDVKGGTGTSTVIFGAGANKPWRKRTAK